MSAQRFLPEVRSPGKRPPRPRGVRIALAILKWGLLAGLALAAAGAAVVAIAFWRYGADPRLPRIGALRDYHPRQVTRILSADGKLIGEIFEERRTYVPLERVSPNMVQAIIDAEDADFRTHEGLDFLGMVRAFWVNLRHGETRQGASTITQQVVKTFLLSPERTFRRKVQEIILARRLENALTKDEILTLYLNQIYFGHGRYGVEEAARFFFAKGAADLDVGEAAVLAGLVQSPEHRSPLKHPDKAKARQIYVLEQMVRRGHLSAADAQKWIDAPIAVVQDAEPWGQVAPEMVDLVRKELAARHGEDALPTLGLTVKTTLRVDLQVAARAAVEAGLRTLDERHGYRGAVDKLAADKVAGKLARLARERKGAPPRGGEIYLGVVTEVSDGRRELLVDLGDWKGAVLLAGADERRYNAEGKKPSDRFAANDLVRVRLAPDDGKPQSPGAQAALALELGPQAAMVVIDPQTRDVLALVGGYGFRAGGFDRALRARRQPGSSFKPFVYAAALDTGEFTPATVVNDAPEVYDLWKPKNYERGEFRGPVRLRQALALSINTVAIRVLHDVGAGRVVDVAKAMGIASELPQDLSLALGSGEVTPLEMTNAFATFAAGGGVAPPRFLAAVGADVEPAAEVRPAIRPEVAYLVTSMMESVVDEGTATAARKLKRRVAGKTGTSNGGRDAWFVGFAPELVAGVWVGFDDMRPLGKGEAGGKAALPIWIDFMKVALKGQSPRAFRPPPGVVTARIDRKTGKLAPAGAADADTLDEVFLGGTVPTEVAPAPGEVDPDTFMLDQLGGDEAGAAGAPEAGGR